MKKAFKHTNEASSQFKPSIKDELLTRANKKHKAAEKKKTYRKFTDSAKVAKERIAGKGIRFHDSKGSGYMKGGKKKYDQLAI